MADKTIISKAIKEQILNGDTNQIYFIDDFAHLDNDVAVTRAMSRLVEEGTLVRIAQGIYLYPNRTRFGIQYPSIDRIAHAIAQKDKAEIIPSGYTAINVLGLSTQVPMNAIYITNGSPRCVNVDGRKITFKFGNARLFAFKSRLFAMAVLAMKEIGEKNITPEEVEHIKQILLASSELELIQQDYLIAPRWIRRVLKLTA